jgi:hypothetical protein
MHRTSRGGPVRVSQPTGGGTDGTSNTDIPEASTRTPRTGSPILDSFDCEWEIDPVTGQSLCIPYLWEDITPEWLAMETHSRVEDNHIAVVRDIVLNNNQRTQVRPGGSLANDSDQDMNTALGGGLGRNESNPDVVGVGVTLSPTVGIPQEGFDNCPVYVCVRWTTQMIWSTT